MIECSRGSCLRTQGSAWCCLVPLMCACLASHGPQAGTETGNPPVIDGGRVALRITTSSDVHITGDAGAVKPGGTPIDVTDITTGAVTHATANADGSFDVPVDGSPDDTFTLRARTKEGTSAPVYVVRGAAAVGSGELGALSCQQRTELAGKLLDRAAADADQNCIVGADCFLAETPTDCYADCKYRPLTQAGFDQLQATAAAIEAGVCMISATDHCVVARRPCPSAPDVRCDAGRCVVAEMGWEQKLSCDQRAQMAQNEIAALIDAADKSCQGNDDCVAASTNTLCTDACGPAIVSKSGKTRIDDSVAGINGTICSGYTSEGCKVLALPCAPSTDSAVCVDGTCTAGTQP